MYLIPHFLWFETQLPWENNISTFSLWNQPQKHEEAKACLNYIWGLVQKAWCLIQRAQIAGPFIAYNTDHLSTDAVLWWLKPFNLSLSFIRNNFASSIVPILLLNIKENKRKMLMPVSRVAKSSKMRSCSILCHLLVKGHWVAIYWSQCRWLNLSVDKMKLNQNGSG